MGLCHLGTPPTAASCLASPDLSILCHSRDGVCCGRWQTERLAGPSALPELHLPWFLSAVGLTQALHISCPCYSALTPCASWRRLVEHPLWTAGPELPPLLC